MILLFFALWTVLNGKITIEIVLFGLAISALMYWFLVRVLNWSVKRDLLLLKTAPFFLVYAANLIREIFLAAAAVAGLALRKGKKPEPVLVEFHSGLDRTGLNVLLANSITLTPGTVTVEQEGDRFLVNALRKEYAEGIENSSFIRLLRRFPK